MVEPGHPLERRELHGFLVDGLGHGVVVAVAHAARRRLDASFCPPFGVPDDDVLRPSIAVAYQALILLRLPCRACCCASSTKYLRTELLMRQPTMRRANTSMTKVHIQPARPGRDIREVADPQLVLPLGAELPVDPVQRTRGLGVNCGSHDLATHHTAQPQLAHQSLDLASGYDAHVACQLPPHLVGALDLHVGLGDTQNLRRQHLGALRPGAAFVGLSPQHCMASIR